MLRRSAALLALVLAGLPAVLPRVASADTWVNTGTQALPLQNETRLGDLPGNTTLQVSVALAMQNRSGLAAYIKQVNDPTSPLYGQFLTPAQFTAQYAPTGAQVQAVESYLSSQGFTNIQVESNHLLITASATAAQAEAAFNTHLSLFSINGQQLFANTSTAQVPASLQGDVASVLGLNDVARMTPPLQTRQTANVNYLASYGPRDFWKIYDVRTSATGVNTAIAIFAEGNLTGTVSDLRASERAYNLPAVPVQIVQTGISSPDTSGADEWNMDTQYSTGMADGVKELYLYDATSLTDSDLAISFNRFASQDVAKAGSASFGECEYDAYLDGSMLADDEAFAEAAAQGQTVFASAGDTGGFCALAPTNGVPAGTPDVNYPASSPYVVAVGGTTVITNDDGTYNQELAWTAGGGGPSLFEYQPYWQSGVAPPTGSTCVTAVACPGKDLPDIAMDADPNSGATVYMGGQPNQGYGGTSLSSPLSLGVWARLESVHGNKIGFAAPRLYAAAGSNGFHDITLGNTGPYPATPGWDYATGNGSFDVWYMQGRILPPPAPTTTPKLASPACTTFTDAAGDAQPVGSTGNNDALDILAGGFNTANNSLSAHLLVRSLNDGPGGEPAISGDGDVWYVLWTYGGTTYFLSAQFPDSALNTADPTNLVSYTYGHLTKSPSGGTLYQTDGNATGNMDTVHNVITITTPLSTIGGPASGATLTGTGGATFESVGAPAVGGALEPADNAGPGSTYTVGKSC